MIYFCQYILKEHGLSLAYEFAEDITSGISMMICTKTISLVNGKPSNIQT